jgi:hypothetical protein
LWSLGEWKAEHGKAPFVIQMTGQRLG